MHNAQSTENVNISNGTLPAGNYTIAQKTTLLIPYDAAFTVPTTQPNTLASYTALSLYRKLKLADGANICSSGGGQITFTKAPTATTTTYQATQDGTTISYASVPCIAAWLQNADGTHVETAGTAANTTYYYYRGAWTTTIPTTMPGDVNGDGVFDQADIDAVALAIVGKRGEVENFDEEVADVDNDGYITIIDLTLLVNQLKGR